MGREISAVRDRDATGFFERSGYRLMAQRL